MYILNDALQRAVEALTEIKYNISEIRSETYINTDYEELYLKVLDKIVQPFEKVCENQKWDLPEANLEYKRPEITNLKLACMKLKGPISTLFGILNSIALTSEDSYETEDIYELEDILQEINWIESQELH